VGSLRKAGAVLSAVAAALALAVVVSVGVSTVAGGESEGEGGPSAQALQALRALRAEVEAPGQGRVPVVVGLRLRLPGGGGAQADTQVPLAVQAQVQAQAQAQAQAMAIAQAQEALLTDLPLTPEARRTVIRFRTIPYLALWADAATLEALARHPRVAFVRKQLRFRPVGLLPPPGRPEPAPELVDTVPLLGGNAQGDFQGYTGAGWAVAVLDTGVDGSHPFLQGKVVQEACFSLSSPFEFIEGACPNGRTQMTGPGAGGPCPAFGCEHGTHVAGIAAGDGRGFPPGTAPPSGVARDAQIVAVQVFSALTDPLGCEQVGLPAPCAIAPDPNVLQGLEYVLWLVEQGVRIAAVNLSLGGGEPFNSEALCDAQLPDWRAIVERLRAAGVAVVVAAGNEGFVNGVAPPACLSGAIAVGATTKDDSVSFFSNSGEPLDLWAPGGDGSGGPGDIYSSVPGGGFQSFGGTSMAAPHVSGAIAVYKQKFPDASPAQVLRAFQATGVPVPDPRNGLVRPRLQLDAALNQAPQPQPQPQPLPEDIVLRVPPREVVRPGLLCFKLVLLWNLRGGPTLDTTVVAVRPVGAGWGPEARVLRGPGLPLRDGGVAPILVRDRSCVGPDLTLEIELSGGIVGLAGLGPGPSLSPPPSGATRGPIIALRVSPDATGAGAGGLLEVRVRWAEGLAQTRTRAPMRTLTVRLYDLGGRQVVEARAVGPRLIALLRDGLGRPLAGGVYLVEVVVEGGADGTRARDLRKLVWVRGGAAIGRGRR